MVSHHRTGPGHVSHPQILLSMNKSFSKLERAERKIFRSAMRSHVYSLRNLCFLISMFRLTQND